jgi:hypothetical protein
MEADRTDAESVDLASSNESGGYIFTPFKPEGSDSEDEGHFFVLGFVV